MARNTNDLVRLIKQAALEAVDTTTPVQITFGTVISASPLQVKVDNKLILESVHLEVPQSLTDYDVEMSVDGGARQTYTIYNSLKLNDKVTLLRFQGGKRYLVIDRV